MSTLTTRILRRAELRSDTPLSKVIESFFIHNGMAAKTKEFYRGNFNAYAAWVKDRIEAEPTLADLDGDYVSAYLRELETKPTRKYPEGSPFRARGACTSLKRLGHWLVEENVLTESPLDRIKKTTEPEGVRQPLTDRELETIRFAAGRSGTRDHALVVFLAATGLRLNEARELRVADLDLDQCQVTVRAMTSKVRRSRTVDFHAAVAKELDRYLRKRQNLSPEVPLFPTDEGAFFKSTESFGKVFARIADDSGIRRFHAHLLRHTWATNWMKQPGGDLLTLMRQGGWKRLQMVERYSHAIPVKDRSALPNPMAEAKILSFTREAKVV
jgi:site-specific recombinase XerD